MALSKLSLGTVTSSDIQSEEVEFTWVVKDFLTQYAISKSTLACGHTARPECSEVKLIFENLIGDESSTWKFQLRQSGEEDVDIFLTWCGPTLPASYGITAVSVKFEAALLNGNGQAPAKVLPLTLFDKIKDGAREAREEFGIKKFTTLSELESGGFLSGGDLKIGLKPTFYNSVCTTANLPTMTGVKGIGNWVMNQDFGKILESGELSDVSLFLMEELPREGGGDKVDKLIELKAHRFVLGATSPVFAAMFENDMKEKTSSRVDIVDVTAKAMKVLLQIIYTGVVVQCQEWREVVEELIYASDKYQFTTLKNFLNMNISAVFTPQNILELRKTLKRHELSSGVRGADRYVRSNVALVLDSN